VLSRGPAKKVTIYVNEDTRYHTGPLWRAIFDYLQHKNVAGATVLRPVMGFGSHHRRHSPDSEYTAEHMPIRIECVDTAARVNEILPTLYDMLHDGLIEVQDTDVVKSATQEARPDETPRREEVRGSAKLMRIFLSQGDKWGGEPLHEQMIKTLRMNDIAGATVYRGILGYGAKGHTHKSHIVNMPHNLPLMIAVVDTEQKIEKAIEAIKPMIEEGLIVLSDVDVIRLAHAVPHSEMIAI
jgi:PII-like signaling protein